MKNYKSVRSSCRLDLCPGEIVCVMDANRNHYTLYLEGTLVETTTVLAPHRVPTPADHLPFQENDTVADLLEAWSYEMPLCDPEEVAAWFGLEEVLEQPFSTLEQAMYYRLQMLCAVLENAPVIECVAPWRLSDFSFLLHGAYTLASRRNDIMESPLPAFVAYDPGYLPGLAFIADRVLSRRNDALVELMAEI